MNIIIIVGNPIYGLRFIGPFDDPKEATMFAEQLSLAPDWWVTTLEKPGDLK